MIEELASGLTKKSLHAPLSALDDASEAERPELMAAFARLYGLSDSLGEAI